MKKLYSILIVTATSLSGFAQLNQGNHAPAANDTYTMLGVDPTGINPGASGSGATWNFASAATVSSITMNYTAIAASSGSYPQANVAVGFSSNNMSYVKSSGNSLLYYGGNIVVQSISATLIYSSPAVWGTYPMALNASSVNATAGSINTSIGNGTFVGSSTVTVDGSGDLILTTGTFNNILRTKTTQTMDFNAGFLNGKLTQETYEWYDGTLKSPLFSIVSATANIGTNYTQLTAQRNKLAIPSGTTSIASESAPRLIVFPQPATQQLTIAGVPATASQIEVFDITGKKVTVVKITGAQLEMNVNEFEEGLYLYNIKDSKQNTLHTGKFTVVH